MAAASPENGGSGGPYRGITGRHFGYTGDPEGVATTAGSGYAVLVEGNVVATSRPLIAAVVTALTTTGSIALTGALVGDTVVSVTDLSTPGSVSADFETTISVAGHIQQTTGLGSADKVLVIVQPQS